jgi:hypothetical protein
VPQDPFILKACFGCIMSADAAKKPGKISLAHTAGFYLCLPVF